MTSVLNGNRTLLSPDVMDNLSTQYKDTTIELSLTNLVALINGNIDDLDSKFEGNLETSIGNIKHQLATYVIEVFSQYREILKLPKQIELSHKSKYRVNNSHQEYVRDLTDLANYFQNLLKELNSENRQHDELSKFLESRNFKIDMKDIKDMINDVRVQIRLSELVTEFDENKFMLQKGVIFWVFKNLEIYLSNLEIDKDLKYELQNWITQNTEELVFTVISIIESYRLNLKKDEIVSVPELPIRFRLKFYDEENNKHYNILLKVRPDLITYQKFYDEVRIIITDYKVKLDRYQNPNDGEKIKMFIYGALAKSIQYLAESNTPDKIELLKSNIFWENIASQFGYTTTPLEVNLNASDFQDIRYNYVDFNSGVISFIPDEFETHRLFELLKTKALSAIKNKKQVRAVINNAKKK